MPPKPRFSEQDIVEAAIAVIAEEGLKNLSARHIANKLGSSTAPVYGLFSSMDEIRHAAVKRILEMVHEYARRPWSTGDFLNMGVGYVIFAREHPTLFRAVFLETNDFHEEVEALNNRLVGEMGADPEYAALTPEQRGALLSRMSVITYGLAVVVAIGEFDDPSDEGIVRWLQQVGSAVIRGQIVDLLGISEEELRARKG